MYGYAQIVCIGKIRNQNTVCVGDLNSSVAAGFFLSFFSLQGRAGVPANKSINAVIPYVSRGDIISQVVRAFAVDEIRFRIIGRAGAGIARVEGDPVNGCEDRIEFLVAAYSDGVIQLFNGFVLIIVRRAGRRDRHFGPAGENHIIVAAMIGDAVTSDVYACRTVDQLFSNRIRRWECTRVGVILIVENDIGVTSEFCVKVDFLVLGDFRDVVKVIGVFRKDGLCSSRFADILKPSGKCGVRVLRVGWILRGNRFFPVLYGLRKCSFSRIRIQSVFYILAKFIKCIEPVSAEIYRSYDHVHRETVGGELDSFSVYDTVHIINGKTISLCVLYEMEHIQIRIVF